MRGSQDIDWRLWRFILKYLKIQYVKGCLSIGLSHPISLHLLTSRCISLHRAFAEICWATVSLKLEQKPLPMPPARYRAFCLSMFTRPVGQTSTWIDLRKDLNIINHHKSIYNYYNSIWWHWHALAIIAKLRRCTSLDTSWTPAVPVSVVLALVRAYCDALARCGLVVTKFSSSQAPSDHIDHGIIWHHNHNIS